MGENFTRFTLMKKCKFLRFKIKQSNTTNNIERLCYISYIKRIFQILVLFISIHAHAQEYGDKEFYLIDSLKIEELSDYDKNLIDSCLTLFHKAPDDTTKIQTLDGIRIRMMHEDWIKYDEWTYSFIKDKLQSKNNESVLRFFKKTIGDIYNNKSIQLIIDGNRAKSLEYTIKSLNIYEEIGDQWRLSSGYSNMGNYYQEDGNYSTALSYYQKGFDIATNANDVDNIAICLLSMGSVYEEQKKYDKA